MAEQEYHYSHIEDILCELGHFSSGRAAELVGMLRVEFLLSLGRCKGFPFEAELRDLDKTYA